MRSELPGKWPASSAVWNVALDIDDAQSGRAYSLLADDEKARADRFFYPRHRRRFIAARAALREVLAARLAVAADDISFNYSAEGKPKLRDFPDWHFSVSHSNDVCMIAVAHGRRLGIDIETIGADARVMDEVVRRFHPAEQRALADLPAVHRRSAFYRCWVRKEALLKAIGVGIGAGLNRLHIGMDESARLIWADPALLNQADWTIIPLDGQSHAAALAIESSLGE